MSRHGGATLGDWVLPNAVPTALAYKYAAVVAKMALEVQASDHDATISQWVRWPNGVWRSELVRADGQERYIDDMRISLTAVYEPVEGGWTQARIEELPAVITAAPTPEEATELLVDALSEYLLSLANSDAPVARHESSRCEKLDILLGA
jgi:predicted RNase H-like HicB family nuclease